MFKSTLTAVALVLMVPQVTLADWMPVVTADGNAISVDDESLVRNGGITSFWRRTIFPVPDRGVIEVYARESVNCLQGIEQRHYLIGYNEAGVRVVSGRSKSKPDRIEPGTVGGAVAEFVCQ